MPEILSKRLGPRLVQQGVITEDQLKSALRKQKRTNQQLGEILIEMDLLTQEKLNKHLEETPS